MEIRGFVYFIEKPCLDSGSDHLKTISEVLALMQLPTLKNLAKIYHIDTNQPRAALVASLERQTTQKSIFGASLHDSMLKKLALLLFYFFCDSVRIGVTLASHTSVNSCVLPVFFNRLWDAFRG